MSDAYGIYKAQSTDTGEWVVMNTRADMIVATRVSPENARRIAMMLNRARAQEASE